MTALALSISYETLTASVSSVSANPGLGDIQRLLVHAQLYAAGAVVGVGGLMGMIAGLMRVVGMREEARKRYSDVMWGTSMVLTAPTLVFMIATIIRTFLPSGVIHV